MSQAPRDAGGVDFDYAPGERPGDADRPRDAATVLRSIWGDEFEAPARPAADEDETDEPLELAADPGAPGLEERIWEVSSRVERMERTLRSLIDRLGAVEAQSKASAEVSAEVASILRELLKPRPAES